MIPAGSDGRGRARRAAGSGKQCLSRARRRRLGAAARPWGREGSREVSGWSLQVIIDSARTQVDC